MIHKNKSSGPTFCSMTITSAPAECCCLQTQHSSSCCFKQISKMKVFNKNVFKYKTCLKLKSPSFYCYILSHVSHCSNNFKRNTQVIALWECDCEFNFSSLDSRINLHFSCQVYSWVRRWVEVMVDIISSSWWVCFKSPMIYSGHLGTLLAWSFLSWRGSNFLKS